MSIPDAIEIWVLEVEQLNPSVNGQWQVKAIGAKFFCERAGEKLEDSGYFPTDYRVRQVPYNSELYTA